MRVRFAPSPTGHLHVGNARTALFNFLLARHGQGTFILRIEDTDVERSTRESELAIMDDLRWMGLTWDEGVEVGGLLGPYRQSERLDLYADYARQLRKSGHGYYCFCSAEQLDADRQRMVHAGLPPKYAGTCRSIPPADAEARVTSGEKAVLRLRVPQAREVTFDDVVRGPVTFHTDVIGDPVLVRSDGMPAYNYAVVIDDALMKVTHVVRGEDHISNTPRQVLLYEAFGWEPPTFAHLSLVMGPDHTPLSKRHGATSVAEFRAKGYLPEALVNYLALIGWSPGNEEEVLPLAELARRFELSTVAHSAGVFDEDKLAWVNRHYLKAAAPATLVDLSLPFLRNASIVVGEPSPVTRDWLQTIVPALASSIDRLSQLPERLRTVFAYDPVSTLANDAIGREMSEPGARQVVAALAADLQTAPRLTDRDLFRAAATRVKEKSGQKGKALFHPIRVVLTGEAEGPELDLLVPAIDRATELAPARGLQSVTGCRERAVAFAAALQNPHEGTKGTKGTKS
ncbi:MAG TPA: glutamate--tRNA ligase [Vicinamibacterales bacterium]|nr:glutamate--tRNA ligase [Vicinamibacterales bacterium]